jgi:hypothetical protein
VLQPFVTFTQYDVVVLGLTTSQLFVAPVIGLLRLPLAPRYHWKLCGTVPPVVVMLSSVPLLTVRANGPLIVGATHVGFTVTATLFTAPQAFVTRTQNDDGPDGFTTTQLFVAPTSGLDVLPDAPMYH